MPPEEELTSPLPQSEGDWQVFAKNSRVNRGWENSNSKFQTADILL